MILTVEAMTDEQGAIQLLSPLRLPKGRRALITVLDEQPPIVTKPKIDAPKISNGHIETEIETKQDPWTAFFEILDELAEEDYTPEDGFASATEAFLATRR